MEDKKYEADIAREQMYWGEFEADANIHGVPWWCDLRRGIKLAKVICGWMYDPNIEWILRGGCKEKLIRTACAVKGNALDLGCGAGWLSLELARRGMNVDGFEISQRRLDIAREYLADNAFKEGFGSINYQIEDINKVSLKKNNYQSVVSWDTLHHIPQIERIIKEIYESLRPGGYFIIYDHIGLIKKNKIVIRILRVPFAIPGILRSVFMAGQARNKHNPVSAGRVANMTSPFEDITQEQMLEETRRLFEIEVLQTHLCFLGVIANGFIPVPGIIKYPLLRILKFIDDALIRAGLLRGEYVFIIARKRKGR